MNEMKSLNWHEWYWNLWFDRMTWHEWVDINELKWMNWQWGAWNEWFEMNELKWRNWSGWFDMNELKGMNWIEWTKRINWNERIEINNLTWMNWNEWIDMNELKLMNWKEWIAKSAPNVLVMHDFYLKRRSRHSLAHILSTSSSKSGLRRHFLCDFMWSTTWWRCAWHMKSISRYSLVRTFCRPHLQKVRSEPLSFLRFLCEIELSLQYRAHFVDLIFKKCKEAVSFWLFLCETELSLQLQSRAYFVDHFPDRGAQQRKQTPSSGDHGHPLYPKKNTGFCARECFQPWIHAFPIAHIPTTWWWCDWHDDVVDMMIEMMMWLSWWWDS